MKGDGATYILNADATSAPSPFTGYVWWCETRIFDAAPITYTVIDIEPLPTIAGKQFWRRTPRTIAYDPPPRVVGQCIDESKQR